MDMFRLWGGEERETEEKRIRKREAHPCFRRVTPESTPVVRKGFCVARSAVVRASRRCWGFWPKKGPLSWACRGVRQVSCHGSRQLSIQLCIQLSQAVLPGSCSTGWAEGRSVGELRHASLSARSTRCLSGFTDVLLHRRLASQKSPYVVYPHRRLPFLNHHVPGYDCSTLCGYVQNTKTAATLYATCRHVDKPGR